MPLLDTRILSLIVDSIMSVALVFVVGFAVLVVVPPAFLALAARLFAAPVAKPAQDCRPTSRPVVATAR